MRCSRLCPSHHLSVWDSLKLIFVSLPLLQYSMKQIPAALGSFTPFSVSCPAEALVICTLLELPSAWLSSATQSCPTLRPHGLQHARLPCPSPTPGACSNTCPWSQWCHPTISSSVVPFSSCPQSLPASGSFPMCQFFASGGQSIGTSA